MGRVPEPRRSPKAPEGREWSWHGTDEKTKTDALIDHGGWNAMVEAHAWYDPDAETEHDPPQEKHAYKLPHHELIDDRVLVVLNGVRSEMGVLLGARGGVDIPGGDRKDVYRHLQVHYEEFDKDVPDYSE